MKTTAAMLTHFRPLEEREPNKRPLDPRLIVRLFGYLRPYAAKRNWLLGVVLIRAVQLPALTWLLAVIIKGPIAHGNVQGMVGGAIAFALLALSTQWVMHYRQRLALELGEAVVHDLRQRMFEHLQTLPMSFYNRTKVGRVISRMTSDVEHVRIGVQDVLFVGLVQLGQMTIAAAFMLWYDWPLFVVVVALAPVLWGINRYFHRRLSGELRRMQESFSRVTATLAESVHGIRVTQAFSRQDVNARLFADLVEDHSQYGMAVLRTQGAFLPLLDLVSQVFIAALLLIGGYQILHPQSNVQIGDLVGFFFMATMFFSPITVLGGLYNHALMAMAGGERVMALLDTPPAWSDPADAVDWDAIPHHGERNGRGGISPGRVEFVDVDFQYLPDRSVLHGVNFTAEPGQTVALVGNTGGGKSTITHLIAKFYLPTAGVVRIDGIDLRRISTRSLRRHLAVVPQQNYLFTGSVLDNIRFGRPEATVDQVERIAEQLGCLDLFKALPDGLQTTVGERGHGLSMGQRQLVCFARALLADPRILILDEATSSIDTLTENRVQQALATLLAGRTSFVVAHRLSTIRRADLVLVIKEGEIVERGTHASLVAADGYYAQMYRRFSDISAR